MTVSDQRSEPRIDVTGSTVTFGGNTFTLKNWSLSGFLISPFDGTVPVEESFPINLHVESNLGVVDLEGNANIIRRDNGELAGKWELNGPPGDAAIIVRYFLTYPDPFDGA